MKKYNPKIFEKKWQKRWEDEKLHEASDDHSKKKCYPLVEFPYPSGDGLHVGHPRPYIALDIIARKRRAEGYNVLYPFGWDAFGLPTENYAIKTGIHPKEVTEKNTKRFKEQVKMLGLSFDWSREINTTDPKYYRWTQWIFLQLFKHGLAYKKKMPINWCLDCKVGLANEEVVDGLCERCGGKTEKREKEQWMLSITAYADRLHDDLDTVDYEERIKIQQRNWIGRSEGSVITFALTQNNAEQTQKNAEEIPRLSASSPPARARRAGGRESATLTEVKVFTTRPDTLFGATYLVLAPEHEIISNLRSQISNWNEVIRYIERSKKKTELERTAEGKEKTGVELKGVKAINPANQEEIPVWIADYILAHYGTGAIMAVPAHDERDYEFGKKYKLPILRVIEPTGGRYAHPLTLGEVPDAVVEDIKFDGRNCWTGEGKLVNSGKFDGMPSGEAREKITAFVNGEKKVTYKLRDWVFSRQRYWGEPIPIMYCNTCWENEKGKAKKEKLGYDYVLIDGKEHKIVPVQEEELPVELPEIEEYKTSESGESPLANISEWVNTVCPRCGGKARRETDTMPQWAGSSWYFLRYADPRNDESLADKKKLNYWTPVDWYNGGMEHTTLHLLYSRFWHKFLFDINAVPSSEPYKKRTSHGLILAEGGEKMSKSKGNVINPDDIVEKVGADAFRLYEMFMGPFDQPIPWNTENIAGVRRFLERVWRLKERIKSEELRIKNIVLEALLHNTIKKVGEDIENLKFNTAVSQLMILVNVMEREETVSERHYGILLRLLAPFAPHISDELWEGLGHKDSIHTEPWPLYDEKEMLKKEYTIAVQVNGKVRATITVPSVAEEDELKALALSVEGVRKWIKDREIKRTIFVKGRLVNIVTDTP